MAEEFFHESHWIWDDEEIHPRNGWFMFRRYFTVSHEELKNATLTICADSRYVAWLNGTRLGQGPIRSWPDQLYPDTYRLDGAGQSGENLLEVLVDHYGLGTCSYIEAPAGLIAEITLDDGSGHIRKIGTDDTWQVAAHPGYVKTVPKMANGLSWAEVYRADLAASDRLWVWKQATLKTEPVYTSRKFIAKDILPLTDEPLWPISISSWQRVRRRGFVLSVNLRWLAFPGQLDLNKHKVFRGFIGFCLHAARPMTAQLAIANDPHDSRPLVLNLNGYRTEIINGQFMQLDLKASYNWALVDVSGMFHDPEFHFVFDLPEDCVLRPLFDARSSSAAGTGGALCFFGPFGSISQIQIGYPIALELPPDSRYDCLLAAKTIEDIEPFASEAHQLGPECVSEHHAALDSFYQKRIEDLPIPSEFNEICRPAHDDQMCHGVDVHVQCDDSELTLDFGRELSGYLEFEIEAAEGTVIDFFCFESQHDGIIEHTFSLNNSLRYVCTEGRQKYRSPVRRGFRYCMVTIRSNGQPVLFYQVRLVSATYPVTRTGNFSSSDHLLNRIWELCRHTVNVCMEDTFVDCPAYEQTFWTGDSYTSSLYSYYLFGLYEFPAHGNRLAARSLERSPLIESTIPSAWQNVIPNWSFLWVLSCIDHFVFSGDRETFEALYPSLVTTIRNAWSFIPQDGPLAGLFVIDAWNFIDWAPLDSPNSGAVTHQNAIFVWTIRRLSEVSRLIGHEEEAIELERYAASLGRAIDEAFWSPQREAYIDCIHTDGTRSAHFSLHSQLFMYLAGCGSLSRRRKIASYLDDPPDDFTDIASPFVRLFYYQALLEIDRIDQPAIVFSSIREVWGNMLKHGATSCWEGWSFIPGHYTRSHCHAWSSSPAFLIGAYMLGVRPLEPGFKTTLIEPYFDTLSWFDGSVPTPSGIISLRMSRNEDEFDLSIQAPKQISLIFRCPGGKWDSSCGSDVHLTPEREEGLINYYSIRLMKHD